ncbi:MAG: hypothetical protein IT379_19565 [Deltaproteobacteria bacterium]|nr:hypothetical protein [Deltaproteobacteria bacterium]
MSGPRVATAIAFAYTVGAGLMLFGLHRYATSPGGHDPDSPAVRTAIFAFLGGALFLAAPAVVRRWAALRAADRRKPERRPP